MTRLTRRQALRMAGVAALLPAWARAEAPPSDPHVTTETVTIPAIAGFGGVLMRPKAPGKHPAIVVAHDVRGLDAHARTVAQRLAAQGYLALLPDYLSPEGGSPADPARATSMLYEVQFHNILDRSRAAFAWLKDRPDSTGKVGTFGYGWGGGAATDLSVIEPAVAAAVSYYGPQSNYFLGLEFKDMKAALMLHYAGRDRAINVGIAQFDGVMRNETSAPPPEIFVYPGLDHGFADETDAQHYDKQAADLAWGRSTGFLKKYLA